MGFFDFLFKKKNVSSVSSGVEDVEVEKKTEPEYTGPKLIAETDYSKTYEEKNHNFEYIDFKIVGTSNYQKEIKRAIKLEKENESYSFDDPYDGMTNKEIREDSFGEKIFQYDDALFSEVSLVLEPDNEYDAEAIAVYIGELKVGHVPKKGFTEGKKYIHGLLTSDKHFNFSVSLKGGKYKVSDGDEVETGELTYGLRAQITIRSEK